MRPVSSRTSTSVSSASSSSDLEVGTRLARLAGRRPPSARGPGSRARAARRSSRSATRAGPRPAPGSVARPRGALTCRASARGRLVVARDDHQPGGVLVEAVHDPGAFALAPAGEVAEQIDERRGRGAPAPDGRPGPRACRRPPASRRVDDRELAGASAIAPLSARAPRPPAPRCRRARGRERGTAPRSRRRSRRRRG